VESAVDEPERRPVEIVVRDKALVAVAAAAVELDAIDGRVRRPGKALDAPESVQRHVRLPS